MMDKSIDGEQPGPLAVRTPWHLWAAGIVSLLWNAVGGLDYTLSQTRNAAYLAAMSPAQMAWMERFPAWEIACWAFGVWGAVAGSLLLLARSRHAVTAFAISLAGLAITTFYQWVINPAPVEARSPPMIGFQIAIWAVAIALLWYARRMRERGTLR